MNGKLIEKLRAWQERTDERIGGFHILVSPLPWDWRLRWYRDEIDRSYMSFDIGPIQITTSLRFWKVDRSKLPRIAQLPEDFVVYDEVQDWSGVSGISKGTTDPVAPLEGFPEMFDWQKRVYEREGWKRNAQGVWQKDG